jgi:hypothetical protein
MKSTHMHPWTPAAAAAAAAADAGCPIHPCKNKLTHPWTCAQACQAQRRAHPSTCHCPCWKLLVGIFLAEHLSLQGPITAAAVTANAWCPVYPCTDPHIPGRAHRRARRQGRNIPQPANVLARSCWSVHSAPKNRNLQGPTAAAAAAADGGCPVYPCTPSRIPGRAHRRARCQ